MMKTIEKSVLPERKKVPSYPGMVSFTMPTYNRAKYLDEALYSIYLQAMPEEQFRVIVVDDGSTDETPEVLKKWTKRENFYWVTGLEHEGNVARIRRKTLALCGETDLIVELDDHDLLTPHAMERILKAVEKGADIVYGYHQLLSPQGLDGQVIIKRPYSKKRFMHFGMQAMGVRAYKKLLYDRAGGYRLEDKLAEDYSLFLRMEMLRPSPKVTCIEETLSKIRVESESISSDKKFEQVAWAEHMRMEALLGLPIGGGLKPRILAIVDLYYPHLGGAEISLHSLLKQFPSCDRVVITRDEGRAQECIDGIKIYPQPREAVESIIDRHEPDIIFTQLKQIEPVISGAGNRKVAVFLRSMAEQYCADIYCPSFREMTCPDECRPSQSQKFKELTTRDNVIVIANSNYMAEVHKKHTGRKADAVQYPTLAGEIRSEPGGNGAGGLVLIATPRKNQQANAVIEAAFPGRTILWGTPNGSRTPEPPIEKVSLAFVWSEQPEAFGRIPIELARRKIPTIGPNFGGWRESIPEWNQFKNVVSAVHRMESLLKDDDEYRAEAMRVSDWAKNFEATVEPTARAMAKIRRMGFITYRCPTGIGIESEMYIRTAEALGVEVYVYQVGKWDQGNGVHLEQGQGEWQRDRVTQDTAGHPGMKAIRAWIQENGLDAVFSIETPFCQDLPMICRAANVPWIWKPNPDCMTSWKEALDADFAYCPTAYSRKLLKQKMNEGQIVACDYGHAGPTYYRRSVAEGESVTFVMNNGGGGQHKRKALDAVVKAFSKVKGNAKLVINSQVNIGHYAGIIEIIRKDGRIEYRNTVGDCSTIINNDLYEGHVSVQPSRFEGLGLTYIESLNAGMPVITNDIPPMNQFVTKDNGILVKSKEKKPFRFAESCEPDLEGLAQAMQYFTDNPDAVQKFSPDAPPFPLARMKDSFQELIRKVGEYRFLRLKG